MDNVIPIRPGIQVPGAFAVTRPVAGGTPRAIQPAGQAAAPSNPWKLAAIVLGTVVVYGVGSYVWHESTAKYRAPARRR